MKCPRCGSGMKTAAVRNVELDMCPACEGVWFDEGELNRIIEMGEKAVRDSALAPTLKSEIECDERPSLSELPCPRCSRPMMRYYYDCIPGIVLDGCNYGCGIFLDDGELHKIFVHISGGDEKLPPEEEAAMQELMKEITEDNIVKDDELAEKPEPKKSTLEALSEIEDKVPGAKSPGKVLDFLTGLLLESGILRYKD
ncbi:MAG: zf-TFIIB domain-containing protein [Chloroflexi bacterium]|nr:zf-TFIIB domain-containing protein [Chloroflexota bacterium]